MMHQRAKDFRDNAPTSASQAATTILDGVREQRWRILVGEDAFVLDRLVRENPEQAYDEDFIEKVQAAGHFGGLVAATDDSAQS